MMRPALMPAAAAAPVNESCDLLCGKINIHLQSKASAIPFAPQSIAPFSLRFHTRKIQLEQENVSKEKLLLLPLSLSMPDFHHDDHPS